MINKKPLVSVIVPIYNTEKCLDACINSILKQSYSNLEIILVDDGSTDSSSKKINEYAKKDARIVPIHKNNGGQSSARNTGLEIFTGQYVVFVDSDDEITENFVSDFVQKMSRNISLIVCGIKYHNLNLKTENDVYITAFKPRRSHESMKKYILKSMTLDGRLYSSVNKFFIGDIIRKNKLTFDTGRNFAEDTMFVLNYIDFMSGEIEFIQKANYIYNFGTETSTIAKSGVLKENWNKLYSDLKLWVGKKKTLSERFWLALIWVRWKISYIRTKKRARKNS